MHGKLTAESTPGEGSTFHFTALLGLQSEEAVTANELRSEALVLESREILVVEDNPTTRRVLQQMLYHWGMKPTLVESGDAAIGLLQEGRLFEYILLDIQLPDIDGFAVAHTIKTMQSTNEKLSKCMIIMMLASTAQRGLVEQHSDLPISVYLNKPVFQRELMQALLKPFAKKIIPMVPKEVKEEKPKEPPTPPAVTPKNGKILLAEDNVVNQKLAMRMLEKLGYNVHLAENGLKAVQAFEREEFDLILMDVQMPEMGGFEATTRIRELEHKLGRRIPIIAMTAHAISGYREKCLEGGMDGYISKPILMDQVKKTIEEFLAQKRGMATVL